MPTVTLQKYLVDDLGITPKVATVITASVCVVLIVVITMLIGVA